MSNLSGKYYSNTFTTSGAAAELLTQFRSQCGNDDAVLKKMTLISAVNIGVKINGASAYSYLYLNSDSVYALSLDARDIIVSSLVIEQGSVDVFLAGVY